MLNKMLRYQEMIPCDKRMHMIVGAVLIATLLIFTTNLYIIFGSLVVVAFGIEFYQKFTNLGTYSNLDAIAVIIGGLIVLLPYLIKGLS